MVQRWTAALDGPGLCVAGAGAVGDDVLGDDVLGDDAEADDGEVGGAAVACEQPERTVAVSTSRAPERAAARGIRMVTSVDGMHISLVPAR